MSIRLYSADAVTSAEECEAQALEIAFALRALGVTTGDRVLLKAENSAAWVTILLALMHLGASIVLVDHAEPADRTGETARSSSVRLVIVDDDASLPVGVEAVWVYELLIAASARPSAGVAGGGLDITAWRALPDSLVLWSSGSTGTPKGVARNGARFLDNLERNADLVGHRGDDVLLPLLPFNHQYGLSLVLIAYLRGCSLVVAPYRRPDRALRQAGRAGVTVVDATPSTYRTIVNLASSRPSVAEDLASARMLCSGAAPLEPGLVDGVGALFGLPLLDSYGSTELGNVAFATLDDPRGCGRVVEGLSLEVRDDQGHPVPAGGIGELFVLDPDLMEGYLDADGVVEPVDRGWYATGDLGHVDADGNLFVVGRKQAVHRNGMTLHPEAIEHRLAGAGCSARIVAAPDQRRGASLVFVVQDDEQRAADYWRTRICDVLPPAEQPNRVLVTDHFPLNRNGKPDRERIEALVGVQA